MKKILTIIALGLTLISCSSTEKTNMRLANERAMKYAKFKNNVLIVDAYHFRNILDGVENKDKTNIMVYETKINGENYLINKVKDVDYIKHISNKLINFQYENKIIVIDYGMAVLPSIDASNVINGSLIFLDAKNKILQIEHKIDKKILAKSKTKKILIVPKNFASTMELGFILKEIK